ncbi:MAG: hypothetical protein EBY37_07150 [Flavobacteriia bacterium]|nr:hypothetical protein [Flavobacteriia bacterium]
MLAIAGAFFMKLEGNLWTTGPFLSFLCTFPKDKPLKLIDGSLPKNSLHETFLDHTIFSIYIR